jgi:hypothetical protein
MGAKQTGSGRSVSQWKGETSTFLERRHMRKRWCVVVYYVRTAYDGSPMGIGRLEYSVPIFITPGYTRGYNTPWCNAHLLIIARSGEWIGSFPTYYHARTHKRFLLAKEEVKHVRGLSHELLFFADTGPSCPNWERH